MVFRVCQGGHTLLVQMGWVTAMRKQQSGNIKFVIIRNSELQRDVPNLIFNGNICAMIYQQANCIRISKIGGKQEQRTALFLLRIDLRAMFQK